MPNLKDASIKPVYVNQDAVEISAANSRTLGKLIGDLGVNVKAFGAVGNGIADDAPAIQAAVEWTTTNSCRGIIWVPPGSYHLASQINISPTTLQPSIRFIGSGSNWTQVGGTTFIGPFVGFLFKVFSNNGVGNCIFEGIHFSNSISGGGAIVFINGNHNLVRDCSFTCYQGVVFEGCNAPSSVDNCHFSWFLDSLPGDSSLGIALGGTGCVASRCDWQGYDTAVTVSSDGNALRDFRIEKNHIGVRVGLNSQRMQILGTATAAGGAKTLCTVITTGTLINEHGIFITDSSTNLNGGPLFYTVVDATHFTLDSVAWSGTNDTTARITGAGGGGRAFHLSGGTFEANDIAFWIEGSDGITLQDFRTLISAQGPNHQGVCNFYLQSGNSIKIGSGVTLSGGGCQGSIISSTAFSGNQLVLDPQVNYNTGNLATATSFVVASTALSIGYGTQAAYTNPPWLVTGLIVSDKANNSGSVLGSGVIPAGTTVTSVTSPNTSSITISAGLTGKAAAVVSSFAGAVITSAAHGLAFNDAVIFSTTGTLPSGLTAATTYYVIGTGLTVNTFEVSLTPGATTGITLSGGSGTLTAKVVALFGGSTLYFYDPNTMEAVGDIYLPQPAGGATKTSYINSNTTLSYLQFNKIWMNPGGGTLTLTIPLDNDSGFNPGRADVYTITQTGTGTANITAAASVTVNGLTSVGGQWKVVTLKHMPTLNTWMCYVG